MIRYICFMFLLLCTTILPVTSSSSSLNSPLLNASDATISLLSDHRIFVGLWSAPPLIVVENNAVYGALYDLFNEQLLLFSARTGIYYSASYHVLNESSAVEALRGNQLHVLLNTLPLTTAIVSQQIYIDTPLYTENYHILSPSLSTSSVGSSSQNYWSFLSVFDDTLWYTLLVTAMIVIIIQWLFYISSPFISAYSTFAEFFFIFSNFFFLQRSYGTKLKTFYSRFLALIFSGFCLIIICIYISKLSHYSLVRSSWSYTYWPTTTLSDLYREKSTVCVDDAYAWSHLVSSSKLSAYRALFVMDYQAQCNNKLHRLMSNTQIYSINNCDAVKYAPIIGSLDMVQLKSTSFMLLNISAWDSVAVQIKQEQRLASMLTTLENRCVTQNTNNVLYSNNIYQQTFTPTSVSDVLGLFFILLATIVLFPFCLLINYMLSSLHHKHIASHIKTNYPWSKSQYLCKYLYEWASGTSIVTIGKKPNNQHYYFNDADADNNNNNQQHANNSSPPVANNDKAAATQDQIQIEMIQPTSSSSTATQPKSAAAKSNQKLTQPQPQSQAKQPPPTSSNNIASSSSSSSHASSSPAASPPLKSAQAFPSSIAKSATSSTTPLNASNTNNNTVAPSSSSSSSSSSVASPSSPSPVASPSTRPSTPNSSVNIWHIHLPPHASSLAPTHHANSNDHVQLTSSPALHNHFATPQDFHHSRAADALQQAKQNYSRASSRAPSRPRSTQLSNEQVQAINASAATNPSFVEAANSVEPSADIVSYAPPAIGSSSSAFQPVRALPTASFVNRAKNNNNNNKQIT